MDNNINKRYLDVVEEIFLILNFKGEITFINRAGREILGCEEKDIVGKNWFDNFIFDKDRKDVLSVFDKLMNEKIKLVEYHEGSINTNNGEKIISWHNSVLRDGNENIIGTVSSGKDITTKRSIEKEARDSEGRYKALFDYSKDAMMTLTPPNWDFTSANRSAIEMLGIKDKEQLVKINPWDFAPEVQDDGELSVKKAEAGFKKAMKDGYFYSEWRLKRADGKVFPSTVLLTKIRIKGKDLLQLTLRDISKEKKKSAELEKMNEFAINRELKMIELKEKINELLKELGKGPKYKKNETTS